MVTLACDEVLMRLVEEDTIIPVLAIILGCTTAMVFILAGTVGGIAKSRARETSRRELAAYVAEGSMKPEDAVALLNAGRPKWEGESCCTSTDDSSA
jgi:hypothetical protein